MLCLLLVFTLQLVGIWHVLHHLSWANPSSCFSLFCLQCVGSGSSVCPIDFQMVLRLKYQCPGFHGVVVFLCTWTYVTNYILKCLSYLCFNPFIIALGLIAVCTPSLCGKLLNQKPQIYTISMINRAGYLSNSRTVAIDCTFLASLYHLLNEFHEGLVLDVLN